MLGELVYFYPVALADHDRDTSNLKSVSAT